MSVQRTPMTRQGYEKLRDELDRLRRVERPSITRAIAVGASLPLEPEELLPADRREVLRRRRCGQQEHAAQARRRTPSEALHHVALRRGV